jgi:hypothetical protein
MANSLTLYRAPMLPGNDVGNATAETQMPNGRATPLQLALPSNNSLANKSFRVRVSGRASTTTNTTFRMKVYFGMATVIASNTLIFDSGSQSINNTKSNFEFWLDMQWDSDSKSITGRGTGSLANNILGPSTLNNVPISADPNRDSNTFLQSGPTYGFTVTGIFGGSSAGNHAYIDEFSLEAV